MNKHLNISDSKKGSEDRDVKGVKDILDDIDDNINQNINNN